MSGKHNKPAAKHAHAHAHASTEKPGNGEQEAAAENMTILQSILVGLYFITNEPAPTRGKVIGEVQVGLYLVQEGDDDSLTIRAAKLATLTEMKAWSFYADKEGMPE